MLAFFPTLEGAGDAVAGIAAAGLTPVTLELLDRFTIAAVDDMNQLGLDRSAAAMLMVESDMPGAAAIDELERAEAACRVAGASDVDPRCRRPGGGLAAPGPTGRALRARAHRRWSGWRTSACRAPGCRTCSARSRRIAARHEVRIGTFGHAGDGNLHPDLVFERGDPNAERLTKLVQADLYRAALDLGGTVTGEHGIGAARREWLEVQRAPTQSGSCGRSRPPSIRSASSTRAGSSEGAPNRGLTPGAVAADDARMRPAHLSDTNVHGACLARVRSGR